MISLRLTVEQVEALAGHTEEPWDVRDDEIMGEGERLVEGTIVYAADHELFLASPKLRADWLAMHTRIAELEAEAAQLREELDERLPILRCSLDLSNELHSAASAALTAAGHPHVDGRTLAERVEALAADRNRWIEPAEYARAVFKAWIAGSGDGRSPDAMSDWLRSRKRADLVARVGLAVVAEVE